MKAAVVLVFFATIALSFAIPVWPTAFSASVLVSSTRTEYPYFFRWFVDQSQQAFRRDGIFDPVLGEYAYTERYRSYDERIEYTVAYSFYSVTCSSRTVSRNFPYPNFANYEYLGPTLINFAVAYRWGLKNTTTDVFSEIDVNAAGDPVRFFTVDYQGFAETWTFFEFDEGPQDPDLYVIPPLIKSICTPPPTLPPTSSPFAQN